MSNVIQYKGYFGSVEFSSDDDVFNGKLLGINDLVTFEGDSVTTLKSAFEEAVEDYLETCKKLKKQPNKPYKGTFNVRIPSTLHESVAIIASRKNISLNDYIKFALGWMIKHEKEVEPELNYYTNKERAEGIVV